MNGQLIAFNLGPSLKINETTQTSVASQYATVSSFINLLLPTTFILAGVILLFLLIGGGFSIVVSGGNAKSVESGKNQIMGAIIGFFVIFAAYWIINIISIFTGVPILNSPL